MKIQYHHETIDAAGTVAALGNFDGVHKGHSTLIAKSVQIAKERGLSSLVYTFDRHPENVLSGRPVTPVITPNDIKAELIASLGVDLLYFDTFDDNTANLSPEEFVHDVLMDKLHVKVAVCGFHYHFGHCGAGNADTLKALCAPLGIETSILPPVTENGMVISSTTIRSMITGGNVDDAALLCGHPFRLRAPVEPGKQLGRRLGFPTANQRFQPEGIIPQFGVYLTIAELGGRKYPGVTNVGVRPTVDDGSPNVETHIIGYSGNAYGKVLTLDFVEKIRPERRFDSLEDLKSQVNSDIAFASEQFAKIHGKAV